jgi:hypothetical protein
MNPFSTESYIALQTDRTRLDRLAYRGWLAQEAAARCNRQSVIGKAAGDAAKHIRRWWQHTIARPATNELSELSEVRRDAVANHRCVINVRKPSFHERTHA